MSRRQLDAEVVHAKLRLIRDLLDDLQSIDDPTPDRLERERIERYAVERILTQLVDLAVSVNNHIAAAILGRAPSDYRNSFELAAQAGALPEELADELSPSVGLRNVLTHEYVEVELSVVARSVSLALGGYRQYVTEIARFLTDNQERDSNP